MHGLFYYRKLPESFWARKVVTVVYTRSRVLTSAINDDKTSYEKFFGKQPSLHESKVFGCLNKSKTKPASASYYPEAKKQFLLVMTVQILHIFYMIL